MYIFLPLINGNLWLINFTGWKILNNYLISDAGYLCGPAYKIDYHQDFYMKIDRSKYDLSTRWDLPRYWITIWFIVDAVLISVCLIIYF